MEQAMQFIISFIIFQLVFLVLRQRFKIKELEQEKERTERSNLMFENMYRNQISLLQGQIDELLKIRLMGNPKIPPSTIEAVKYAMKHAHPDNGGNAEDFIKFKKVYEEIANNS